MIPPGGVQNVTVSNVPTSVVSPGSVTIASNDPDQPTVTVPLVVDIIYSEPPPNTTTTTGTVITTLTGGGFGLLGEPATLDSGTGPNVMVRRSAAAPGPSEGAETAAVPLQAVPGMSATAARRLMATGIEDARALASSTAAQIMPILGWRTEERAQALIDEAKRLVEEP
jgi:hypothetical protein